MYWLKSTPVTTVTDITCAENWLLKLKVDDLSRGFLVRFFIHVVGLFCLLVQIAKLILSALIALLSDATFLPEVRQFRSDGNFLTLSRRDTAIWQEAH